MKNKMIICAAMAALVLALSIGCGATGCGTRLTDEELAMQGLERVITAINNKDKAALKALFSEQANTEEPNIDGQIDELFPFFETEIVRWEFAAGGPNTVENINGGTETLRLITRFYVYTDTQEYQFFLLEWPIEKIEPKNKGLYALQVQLKADEDTISFKRKAGITLFLADETA